MKQPLKGTAGAIGEHSGSNKTIAKVYKSPICKIVGARGEQRGSNPDSYRDMKPAVDLAQDMKKSSKGAVKAGASFSHWKTSKRYIRPAPPVRIFECCFRSRSMPFWCPKGQGEASQFGHNTTTNRRKSHQYAPKTGIFLRIL